LAAEGKRGRAAVQRMETDFAEKYRNIIKNIEELYYEVDLRGNLIFLNDSMTRILGYSMEELRGMNNRQYMNPETAKRVYQTFNQVYRTGIPTKAFDWELIRKDGSIRVLETSVSLMRDSEGRPVGFYGIGRDITERKQAARELKEREEKYRSIVDHIEELYYEVDLRGNLIFLNGSMTRILGYTMEELTGMNNRQYMSPETAKRVFQTFNQVYKTGIPTKAFDWELIRKDGSIRALETSVSLIRDNEGRPVGFYGIGRDITERKQAEELERNLRRAKDKALHHLSHELRTPLSIIQGITRILKRRFQKLHLNPEQSNLMAVLENHLIRLLDIHEKADRIIQYNESLDEVLTLQEFAQFWKRLGESKDIPPELLNQWKELNLKMTRHFLGDLDDSGTVNLTPLVRKVLERTKENAKHRDILFLMNGEENLFVRMDHKIIEEIFEGLLRNAVENTPDEGRIETLLGSDGERFFFKVRDFGIGITEENQKYIFDGLFATREMDLYSSKKPYDFFAGGKGLDLFKMKIYGQRFGFDVSVKSQRCDYLPTDRDLCPGRISRCLHSRGTLNCSSSGGSTFCVSFPFPKNSQP
jgi:PAS domain S-box-containing protein